MNTFIVILLICLGLAGCATPVRQSDREAAAEARGYERGYRHAVKEQYWMIQNQQRRPAPAEPTTP
jgi:uncharacterized protein YceK